MNELTPFLPSESHPKRATLLAMLDELHVRMRSMSANIHPLILDEIKSGIGFVNNYYSNLIESEGTHPADIEKAMKHTYSDNPESELKQRTAMAYQNAQNLVRLREPSLHFDLELVKKIHQAFYSSTELLPEQLVVRNNSGKEYPIIPGETREQAVEVGNHLAPKHSDIPRLMSDFERHYSFSNNEMGAIKLMKTFAAHHRFMFIHPFLDGNGRIGRLLTDAMLKTIAPDAYGLWSLSRGLARNSNDYKIALSRADLIRQSDTDGRGQRTESGLVTFIELMTQISMDQVEFMSSKLSMNKLFERIERYAQYADKPILPEYIRLVPNLLVNGSMKKSEAHKLMGCTERHARDILKKLKSRGVIKDLEDSVRSPFTLHFNSDMLSYLFPSLVPPKN